MRMMPSLLLPLLFAASTSVACGSLYPSGYDDQDYVEPGEALPEGEDEEQLEAPVDGDDEGGDEAVAAGEDVGSVDVFYDALDEYGVWQQDPEYGYVFAPSAEDYVPYTDGYWVQTEYGQTWVAEDSIGWAVCHYGRWFYRDRWLWLPGTVWGPSWVDWRVGGGYVGWAPLGFGSYGVPYYSWRFVASDYLYARGLRGHYRRLHEVRDLYPRTERVDRYVRGRNGQRYVAGPAHVPGASSPPPVRLRSLPARATGRFAAHAGAGRRGAQDGQRESYRASRARSERNSRAGLDPAPRRPTRRYAEPRGEYRPGARPADDRRRTRVDRRDERPSRSTMPRWRPGDASRRAGPAGPSAGQRRGPAASRRGGWPSSSSPRAGSAPSAPSRPVVRPSSGRRDAPRAAPSGGSRRGPSGSTGRSGGGGHGGGRRGR